mmetsp:Transcript_1429/g.2903  ORF Transcript_1429/g.2903 Transcript_1429/m.2903 type:complete len:94 (-) Transcript_1429:87-368(-)
MRVLKVGERVAFPHLLDLAEYCARPDPDTTDPNTVTDPNLDTDTDHNTPAMDGPIGSVSPVCVRDPASAPTPTPAVPSGQKNSAIRVGVSQAC